MVPVSVVPPRDVSVGLTTARYFTPSGACINGIGITPDVAVEESAPKEDNDEKSVSKENKKDVDAIFSDLEHKKDNNKTLLKKDQADPQLQSAINIIKGIKIDRKFQQK